MYYISVLPVAFPTLRTDMTFKIIKVNAGEKLLIGIKGKPYPFRPKSALIPLFTSRVHKLDQVSESG